MDAALQKEVINEHMGQTLEEYSSKVKELEKLSKKACFVMPYPADADDWEAFWEQLGKPEAKVVNVNKFKKVGWSMIGIAGTFKNKPKSMKKLPSRRMSTAGFRQLQNRASRLSMSQESFVKQNKKLHKNKKIRKIKPNFESIKEAEMQPLTEDVELEELAGRITQNNNTNIEEITGINQEAKFQDSQQIKRDSSLIQRVESKVNTEKKEEAKMAGSNGRIEEESDDKKAQLEKIQQLLKTVQDMLENN